MPPRLTKKTKELYAQYRLRIDEIHCFALENHAAEPERAIELLKEAVELCEILGDKALQIKSLNRCAYSLMATSRFKEAVEILQRSLSISLTYGLEGHLCFIYNTLGNAYYYLGKYNNAKAEYQNSYAAAGVIRNYADQVTSLSNMANICIEEGNLAEGLEFCQKGFALCKEKNISDQPDLLHNAATIYSAIGTVQTGLECYLSALEAAKTMNNIVLQANILHNIGQMYQENGDTDSALEYSLEALKLQELIGRPHQKARLLNGVSESLISARRYDEAQTYLDEAWEIASEKTLPAEMLDILMTKARLNSETGGVAEAVNLLDKAAELSEKISSGMYTERILLQKGRLSIPAEREILLTNALKAAQKSGKKIIIAEIYSALYQHYEQIGNSAEEFRFYKLFHTLKKEIDGEVAFQRWKVEQVHKNAEKARLETESLSIQNKKLEEEARQNKEKFDGLRSDLVKKNQLLSQISIDATNAIRYRGLRQRNSLNSILRVATQGTTSLWQEFEERSKLVQGELVNKLIALCPGLTPSELRIIFLLKSGLSNKEVASMLSTEERSIETRRTSIRKKLNIPRNKNLLEFLNSL